MDTSRWQQIRTLFDRALDVSPGDQESWLDSECGDDNELRREVEELLILDSDTDSRRLDDEVVHATLRDINADSPMTGLRVGQFRIDEMIGAGGMGTVYRATQDKPARAVALKMIRTGFASPRSRRRFEYEAEILGQLHHPGIAQVFEAGTFEEMGLSMPYFAMELIEAARGLDQYLDEAKPNLDSKLELFVAICDAVHYGHQKGIVHRDLKPPNILVDSHGNPKIIDFGIARATRADGTKQSLATETGQVLGTLQYMSPEQLNASGEDIDTRSDVYALGVILYESFAGRPPFNISDLPIPAAIQIVQNTEPERPSSVARREHSQQVVPKDVDWIIAKAMAKDRDRRYGSASELARDLQRFLKREPVEAGPPSAFYLLSRYARRHRTSVVAASLVLAALIAGLTLSTIAYVEADAARADLAEVNRLQGQILSGVHHSGRGREVTLAELLAGATSELEANDSLHPRIRANLYASIGASYYGLSMLDEAQELLDKAVLLAREHLPPTHTARLQALNILGAILSNTGEAKRAEEMLTEALAVQLEVLGEADMETAVTRATLGHLLAGRDAYAEAAEHYRLALHTIETVGKGAPRLTSITKDCLANCLDRMGQTEEAERLTAEALQLARQYLGPEHTNTLIIRHHHASSLARHGELDRAVVELRDIANIGARVLGEGHPTALMTAESLAEALQAQGNTTEAASILERAIARGKAEGLADSLLLARLQKRLTKLRGN